MADAADAAAPPPTRWALVGAGESGYAERFEQLIADGADIDGEARLADALLPRGARVLDAGSGLGRVGAALQARGHRVVGVEPDTALVARSRALFPDLPVLALDIMALTPAALADAGQPREFDLVVAVGNVLTFVAEDTEVAVLRTLRGLLAPGGRLLVGFHLQDGPATARVVSPDAFAREAGAAGLRVVHRFGGYDLRPVDDAYAVWVLEADPAAEPASVS